MFGIAAIIFISLCGVAFLRHPHLLPLLGILIGLISLGAGFSKEKSNAKKKMIPRLQFLDYLQREFIAPQLPRKRFPIYAEKDGQRIHLSDYQSLGNWITLAHQRITLQGDSPGALSFALISVMDALVARAIQAPQNPIPLYLNAGTWSPDDFDSLEEWINLECASHYSIDLDTLEDDQGKRDVCFLLDNVHQLDAPRQFAKQLKLFLTDFRATIITTGDLDLRGEVWAIQAGLPEETEPLTAEPWLAWLANQMEKYHQTIFYVDDLDELAKLPLLWGFGLRLMAGLFAFVMVAFAVTLTNYATFPYNPNFEVPPTLEESLKDGLVLGALFGAFCFFATFSPRNPLPQYAFKPPNWRIISRWLPLVGIIPFGLVLNDFNQGVHLGVSIVLLVGAGLAIFMRKSYEVLAPPTEPMWRLYSFWGHGLWISAIMLALMLGVYGFIFQVSPAASVDVGIMASIFGVCLISQIIYYSGELLFRHLLTREHLARKINLPRRLVKALDNQVLLVRAGAGYRFADRNLQIRLAATVPEIMDPFSLTFVTEMDIESVKKKLNEMCNPKQEGQFKLNVLGIQFEPLENERWRFQMTNTEPAVGDSDTITRIRGILTPLSPHTTQVTIDYRRTIWEQFGLLAVVGLFSSMLLGSLMFANSPEMLICGIPGSIFMFTLPLFGVPLNWGKLIPMSKFMVYALRPKNPPLMPNTSDAETLAFSIIITLAISSALMSVFNAAIAQPFGFLSFPQTVITFFFVSLLVMYLIYSLWGVIITVILFVSRNRFRSAVWFTYAAPLLSPFWGLFFTAFASLRAEIFLEWGQLEQAEKGFRYNAKVADWRTTKALIWRGLAEINLLRGNLAQARACIDKALQKDGTESKSVLLSLAIIILEESIHKGDPAYALHAYSSLDKVDELLKQVSGVEKIFDEQIPYITLAIRAWVTAIEGKHLEAEAYLRQALNISDDEDLPNNAYLNYLAARAWATLGDLNLAEHHLARVHELSPQSKAALLAQRFEANLSQNIPLNIPN